MKHQDSSPRLRVAFDLDDLLLGSVFPTERPHRRLLGRIFRNVPLRQGTTALLQDLQRQGVECWIYTSSLRSVFLIRCLFDIPGIRLGGLDLHPRPSPTN